MQYYTWQEIEGKVKTLADVMKNCYPNIKQIYGIPRGGSVVAVMLSHQTGLKCTNKPNKKTLVVDDVVDYGKTMSRFKERGITTASIFYKPHSIILPDFYVECVSDDIWVCFPWENKDKAEVDCNEFNQRRKNGTNTSEG